jgi:hypothetical protein
MTNALNPHSRKRCATLALVASFRQVQYRYIFLSRGNIVISALRLFGLNSNRAGNANSARTVITMAAYIGHQYLSRAFCLQLRGQYLYCYAWYNAISALLPSTTKRDNR